MAAMTKKATITEISSAEIREKITKRPGWKPELELILKLRGEL